MTIDQTKLIGGPCKITVGSTVLYSAGDVSYGMEIETRPIGSSALGDHDETVQSNVLRIRFKPKSVLAYHTILLPTSIIGATYMGSRLFSSTDQAVVILGENGDQLTAHNMRITKLPDVFLGMGDDMWGEVEFTGLYKQGSSPTDANSMFTFATGVAFSMADFPTSHSEQAYTAVWTGKTGYTALQAQNGFKISPKADFVQLLMEKQLVNYALKNLQFMTSFIPVGPTGDNLLTAAALQGTGGGPGRRLSTGAADLTITGTGLVAVQKSSQLKTGGYKFGIEPLRHDEMGLVTTTNAVGARFTFTTS